VRARAIVEAAAGEAVAVCHLDGVDPGRVERGDDLRHVVATDPVPDGVHAVTQGDVLEEDAGGCAGSVRYREATK